MSGFTDSESFGGIARGSTGENGVGKSIITKSTSDTTDGDVGIAKSPG